VALVARNGRARGPIVVKAVNISAGQGVVRRAGFGGVGSPRCDSLAASRRPPQLGADVEHTVGPWARNWPEPPRRSQGSEVARFRPFDGISLHLALLTGGPTD